MRRLLVFFVVLLVPLFFSVAWATSVWGDGPLYRFMHVWPLMLFEDEACLNLTTRSIQHLDAHDYDLAITYAQRARDLSDYTKPGSTYALALGYVGLGRLKEARQWLDRTCEEAQHLDPSRPYLEPHFVLVQVCFMQGDVAAGARECSMLLASHSLPQFRVSQLKGWLSFPKNVTAIEVPDAFVIEEWKSPSHRHRVAY